MSNTISSISQTPPNSLSPQGSSRLGKDEFLKLLVTQLSNQDPLQPVDNQAFIAQLAQFATVEQQDQMNATLQSLLLAQASGNQTNVAALVGKEVTFKSSNVVLPAEGPIDLTAKLSGEAQKVNAIIKDQNGRVVRSITVEGRAPSGDLAVPWDGLDAQGKRAPPGTYSITFTAADAKGVNVAADAHGTGRATGVSFVDGIPHLIVNGARVRLTDVQEIHEPKLSNSPQP
jgi:flagellar basal-body rod modification protein FlgD